MAGYKVEICGVNTAKLPLPERRREGNVDEEDQEP